jgi:hypothetical protein
VSNDVYPQRRILLQQFCDFDECGTGLGLEFRFARIEEDAVDGNSTVLTDVAGEIAVKQEECALITNQSNSPASVAVSVSGLLKGFHSDEASGFVCTCFDI